MMGQARVPLGPPDGLVDLQVVLMLDIILLHIPRGLLAAAHRRVAHGLPPRVLRIPGVVRLVGRLQLGGGLRANRLWKW